MMILKEITNDRRIFRDMGMNKWRETAFRDLKKGNRFRIYSPAGRPLELGGEEAFVAISDPYLQDDTFVINVKPL